MDVKYAFEHVLWCFTHLFWSLQEGWRAVPTILAAWQVNIIAAERDVYVATVDDRLLLKLGPADYAVDGQRWKLAESGNNFAVYENIHT